MQGIIKDKSFYRSILRLSLPTAFQSLISLLVVMADNIMVARIDPNGFSLAAVAQSNSITNFSNALLSGLAGGSIVLISQYWGRQDKARIREVYAVIAAACIAVSLAVIILIRLFPTFFISLVINPKEMEITALALEYLPIVCLSCLPFAITAAVIGMLKGVEVVRVTIYLTATSLISNVTLNYILIFGKLGFPAMGVRGAAIATLLARIIEASLVCFYFFRVQKVLPVTVRDLTRQRAWAWKDYARYGLPVGITDAQWALVGMIKTIIIGQLGKMMINAAAVTDMLMTLGYLFSSALASGACVLVGKAVGKKDYPLVRQYATTIQIMFFLLGLVMTAIVFLLRAPFISLYALDEATHALALTMSGLAAFTLIGTTYHAACFVGINRGAGDNKFVMMVDMICGWLIVLPLTALAAFVFKFPLYIVYFFTKIDQTFKWLIAFIRLRGDKWIHNVTREDSP